MYNICNLKFSVPNKNAIAVHNVYNYCCHFIIKVLPKEFEKEDFYSHLNIEDITNADYVYTKVVLLADVFEIIRNMGVKIFAPDLAHFVTEPGLEWQAALKKAKIRSFN